MTDFIYKTNAGTEEEARERCLENYSQSKIFKGIERGNKIAIIENVEVAEDGTYIITGRLE